MMVGTDEGFDLAALLKDIDRIVATENAPSAESAAPDEAAGEPTEPIGIEFDAVLPAINYAATAAGIPVLRRLRVYNNTTVDVEAATLLVTLQCDALSTVVASHLVEIPMLSAGSGVLIEDVKMEIDLGTLAQLDESVPANCVVEVACDGVQLARRELPTRLLAYNEFYVREGMHELVAAHVMPNDPAIVSILQAAGAILAASTGDSGIEGYQSGGNRAVLIAGAIYEALKRSGIGYINPPASFEETGQKIRTPDQVINDRLGTCLDLACTYAACLEQAGLNPLVYIIQGHAYAGFWKEDGSLLKDASVGDWNGVLNAQDAGLAIPVETTAFTTGAPESFDEAVAIGLRRIREADVFKSLVDVRRARLSGILPLPARLVRDGAVTIIVQQPDAATPLATRSAPTKVASRASEPDHTPPRMRQWKAGLLDLSLRNPLLNLKTGRNAMGLLVPGGGLGLLEDLLMQGAALNLFAYDELTELHRQRGARTAADVDAKERLGLLTSEHVMFAEAGQQELRRRCKALMDKGRSAEEENGTNILHVTLGSLLWSDPKTGKATRSPILLLPAHLRSAGRGKPMELIADPTGGTTKNHCLLHRLKVTFNLHVPELEEPEKDEYGVDVPGAIEALRRAIVDEKLDMRVDEDAAIALLDFGKFRMWKDLQDFGAMFLQHPVIKHFVERPGETFEGNVPMPSADTLDQTEVFCPIPCDGAQRQAIIAAAEGVSFVLEGPPGSGKSQTIANLVANAMATERRVLFVAEKRAALNAVKNRLDAVGLGPFCLDVHGKGASVKALREQLIASLDFQAAVDMEQWQDQRRLLDSHASGLGAYAVALHSPGPLGQSAWEARQRIVQLGDGPSVPIDATQSISVSQVTAAVGAARELPEIAAACGPLEGHPWGMITDSARAAACDRGRMRDAIAAIGQAHEELSHEPAALRALLESTRTLDSFREVFRILPTLNATHSPAPGAGHTGPAPSDGALRSARHAAKALGELLAAARPVRAAFADSVFDIDLAATLAEIRDAQQAFLLVRGRRTRDSLSPLAAHLKDCGTPIPLAAMTRLLDQASRCVRQGRDVIASLKASLGPLLPADWQPWAEGAEDVVATGIAALEERTAAELRATAEARAVAEERAAAEARAAVVRQAPGAVQEWFASNPDVERSAAIVRNLVSVWQALIAAIDVTENDWTRWVRDRSLQTVWDECGPAWKRDVATPGVLGLRRWAALLDVLDRIAAAGFPTLRQDVLDGRLQPGAVQVVLSRTCARAALEERLAQPELATFDGLTHARGVRAYQGIQSADAEGLKRVVPAKLLATRPFKPGQRFGLVAELYRNELTKQKGGLPIRGLLKRYAKAIVELAPCFLMSPDSVAQFLEPGLIPFDLVVFDEASQVPVCDAIGAIARGKSVVIVGDSRQMPPTSFFGGGDDDSDVPPDLVDQEGTDDLDSILSESRASGLPSLLLSWHYRSQVESLIAFSNTHYYGGLLSSFPAPVQAAARCGLRWRRVENGVFERGKAGTNRTEAEAVVAEVQARMLDPELAKLSIGIVTLNLQQQELVKELLDEAALESPALDAALKEEDVERRLFVKNLESVQGDERDVILLSVGFGPDVNGKMTMNFGPLNRAGGERRLNVAITRARRELVVFSSMDPEMIHVDRVGAGATGVVHLRAFLEAVRDGARPLAASGQAAIASDLHREEIAAALRAAGLIVATNIGLSSFRVDLALADAADPSKQLVAVLLDGPGYRARRTVQDREVLPSAVLQGMMRWPATMRIWLPEWLYEHERIVAAALDLVSRTRQSVLEQEAREATARTAAEEEERNAAARPTEAPSTAVQQEPTGAAGSDDLLEALGRIVSGEQDLGADEETPPESSEDESPPSEDPLQAIERIVAGEPDRSSDDDTPAEDPASAFPRGDFSAWLAGEVSNGPVSPDDATSTREPDTDSTPVLQEQLVAPTERDPEDQDFTPYVSGGAFGSSEDLDHVSESGPAGLVRSAIGTVVSAEGPVELERLAVIVVKGFGLAKVRKGRAEQVTRLVPSGQIRRSDFGQFVWPIEIDPETWRTFRRTPADCDRPVDVVSPEEIRNAMVYFATRGMSIAEDSVLEELAAVFQIGRMSTAIRTRLSGVLAWALAQGDLRREGDRIVPGNDR